MSDSGCFTPDPNQLVLVGEVGPARGLDGEVMVRPYTDIPEQRFAVGNVLFDDEGYAWIINRFRVIKNRYCLTFDGINSRTLAEQYRGYKLYTLEDSEPEEDAYSREQLRGFKVQNLAGDYLGEVQDLQFGAAQDLLVVGTASGEQVLVPFVKDLVPEVNENDRVIVLNPPAGMFDGNPIEA